MEKRADTVGRELDAYYENLLHEQVMALGRFAVGSAAKHPYIPPEEIDDTDPGGPLAWQERALCAQTDPEAFFPEQGGSTADGKRVCQKCEVRPECLEYALDNDERYGIWGGLSERERRKLQRRSGDIYPNRGR